VIVVVRPEVAPFLVKAARCARRWLAVSTTLGCAVHAIGC
jgi:hypothetical protein